MEGLLSGSDLADMVAVGPGFDRFTLFDIGCSDGIDARWRCFGDRLAAFCFDPDAEEYARLTAADSGWKVLGLGLEVNFDESEDDTEHSFHNTNRLMRSLGFDLFGLSVRRYSLAADILLTHRDRLDALIDVPKALDLLAAQVQADSTRKLSYVKYMAAYEADSPLFYLPSRSVLLAEEATESSAPPPHDQPGVLFLVRLHLPGL